MLTIEQYPSPQSRLVRRAGDLLKVSLTLSQPSQGDAYIRTNLGHAAIHRQELVERHEKGAAMLGRDWGDVQMPRVDGAHFELFMPLWEVGYVDFKCFFIPQGTGRSIWARGDNVRVKVEPAFTMACNTIYNAFVRQFGPNCSRRSERHELREAMRVLDEAGYNVIPPSGTYADFASKLDVIMGEMGFRIIQFLPVHPTPTTYGRMGRFGSPFAPLDFFSVDAGMAFFDPQQTPLDQFQRVVAQIHAREGLVFLDLPIDHTGWASTLQLTHPEWFQREANGAFTSPGAWGVVWADLCKLDFSKKELWQYLADVFIHWCSNGVDGFRCDAGYMIPAEAWKYIIAKVRQQFSDALFFLEGLGGGMDATTRLLDDAGLDWAYSELFQNYSRDEVSRYMDFACGYSATHGALVNFAETHDNERLAAKGGARWARLRVLLNALFAPAGCFGIANGVEWLATERIDVHDAASLNWGAKENLTALLASINRLLLNHPAFWADATVRVPYGAGGNAVGLLRQPAASHGGLRQTLMVIVNPSLEESANFEWNFQEFEPGATPVDILTGRRVSARYRQCQMEVRLRPGEVLCLSAENTREENGARPCTANEHQQLRATAMQFAVRKYGAGAFTEKKLEECAAALFRNPLELLKRLNGDDDYLPVVEWYPEHDTGRMMPVPPKHFILVNCSARFHAAICLDGKCLQYIKAIPRADGRFFALFQPVPEVTGFREAELQLAIYTDREASSFVTMPVCLLPTARLAKVHACLPAPRITAQHCALATTALGSYGLLRAAWGTLESQYDAMLAVNPDRQRPSDRVVVLPRCRAWVIHRDFSQPLSLDCQESFTLLKPNRMRWDFIIPTGMGKNIRLRVTYQLDYDAGTMRLNFQRLESALRPSGAADSLRSNDLEADQYVTLMLRPDVDDRSNHANTRAAGDTERLFPKRVVIQNNGFDFQLACGQRLAMRADGAKTEYIPAPEWSYSVRHRLEAERGLDAQGDLFSPGYFKIQLTGGGEASLVAAVISDNEAAPEPVPVASGAAPVPAPKTLHRALQEAMEAFVVQRDGYNSIIAGYPWFLDWGRDTLLCTRGLVAAGRFDEAASIIRVFASYEDRGTLPNMINGSDVSNRDTSDAALLLFVAVKDYIARKGRGILKESCGGRPLLTVLRSIADNYIKGTPNGIRMDAESGLVFSPAHFTWMDTNYPAATPREGYPVEIQALWYSALALLEEVAPGNGYGAIANRAADAFARLFHGGKFTGLADCLHASPGTPASKAVPDDACRPNQLIAVTAGIVTDAPLRRHILQACAELLVPGAIRTISKRPVQVALPVIGRRGEPLNDPLRPYWGSYCGEEDTRRKPAYHNGTAWGLLLPSYCEGLLVTYGASARESAAAILATTAKTMERACLGQLPEILDGDFPHTVRGCCAQAWSVTETYRVLKLLEEVDA